MMSEPVMTGEILRGGSVVSKWSIHACIFLVTNTTAPGQAGQETRLDTHKSGLFCVSMTAAMGIPKFDAGPQKSA